MGHSGCYTNRLSQVLSSQGKLFPNANPFRRRAHDYILPLSEMWESMEGKLTVCRTLDHPSTVMRFRNYNIHLLRIFTFVFLALLSLSVTPTLADGQSLQQDTRINDQLTYTIVIFMCIWKRPLVTQFVLNHFASLNETLLASGISVELFLVGSDTNATKLLADAVGAAYAIHPNNPVGRKHQLGLESLRAHYSTQVNTGKRKHLPHAITIFGSDDVVPARYFFLVRQHFGTRSFHVLGLRDVWFHDLSSRRLAYTPGYRSFESPLAGTVGCGRAFSWPFLDSVHWRLWDVDRDRGLDQSVVRNLFRANIFMPEISIAIIGRDVGVYAVDIKTDAYQNAGANVWAFDSVISAAGNSGRLLPFSEEIADVSFRTAFGKDFSARLNKLRQDMEQADAD